MYKHTQFNPVMVFGAFFTAVLIAVIGVLEPVPEIFVAVIAVICFLLFGFLTITVGEGKIRWYFGPGIWRCELDLDNVESIAEVRNKWYLGVGIRHFSKGKLYNVGGLDAVEVKTKKGEYIRLGSDESKLLKRAIESRID